MKKKRNMGNIERLFKKSRRRLLKKKEWELRNLCTLMSEEEKERIFQNIMEKLREHNEKEKDNGNVVYLNVKYNH